MASTNSESTNYQQTYGKRPSQLSREKVSTKDEELSGIRDITELVGPAGEAAEDVSQSELATKIRRLEQALPGYTKGVGAMAQLAQDWMEGKPSQSFQDQMAKRASARGISLGMPGSQFAGFGELSSYGRALEELQLQGMSAMQQVGSTAQSIVGDPFKTSSMFLTPDARVSLAVGEADRAAEIGAYNRSLMAMPDAGLVAQRDEQRMNMVSGAASYPRSRFGGSVEQERMSIYRGMLPPMSMHERYKY